MSSIAIAQCFVLPFRPLKVLFRRRKGNAERVEGVGEAEGKPAKGEGLRISVG